MGVWGREPCRGMVGDREGISLGGRTRDWNRASRGSPAACRGVSSGRILGNERGDERWVSMSSCWTGTPGRAAAPGTRRPSPGPRGRASVRARAALTASAMAPRGAARARLAAAAARSPAGRPPASPQAPPARPAFPARARAAVGPGCSGRAGRARDGAAGCARTLSGGPRRARGPRAAPAPAARCAAVPAPLQQGSCTAAAMLIQTASWEACRARAVQRAALRGASEAAGTRTAPSTAGRSEQWRASRPPATGTP